MTIYVGSARIDERGKLSGGQAGDQTGNEVSMQPMYYHSQGWYILRAKSIVIADRLAEAMKIACNNPNLGYDQSQRLGVITYGVSSKVKTECDCSSLVRACCIHAGFDTGNFSTADEKKKLLDSGYFDDAGSYVNESRTPVYNGDILVTKTKGHTVIVVEGSPRYEYYPRYTGKSDSIVAALAAVGEKDTSREHRAKIAAANGIRNYAFTATQNISLVSKLKSGVLVKVER